MKYAKISALILCLALLGTSAVVQAQQKPFDSAQGGQGKRAITFDDLISMHRVGEAQISPDGKWVAYSVGTPDLSANRTVRNIWLVPTTGAEPRQLTRSGRDSRPQWSPDGKKLAFLSSRDGAPQIYLIAVEGGPSTSLGTSEATKVTSLSTGADNVRWSPDGKTLAFTSEVYPDCRDDACNEKRDAEREKSKVQARIYETLLYRHWTEWSTGKRGHLFVVPATGGTPRDLTAGANYDVPPVQRGDANDIAFSPDSKELCYVAVPDKVEATSTNGELFLVPVAGGESKRITTNPGFDGAPAYSPDGRSIAYHAQLRAGYESDRWRLMLYDRKSGQHINLTENFDRSVNSLAWAPDSKTIYFNYEDHMQMPIANIAASAGAQPKPIITDTYNGEFTLSADGRTLVITRSSLVMPAELFVANNDGTSVRQLTRLNAERLAQLDLPKTEYFSFKSVDGVEVHGMLVKPPKFEATKKYPVVMLCHGGPQTMWSDNWGYRWNAQMFASPGFVVVMINRRGSTGFGQKFTDEIAGDYGGKAYEDLMTGLGYVVGKYPFIDGERAGAAGASFGGFMIDWIATHAKGRFKALVSHDGVWNQESFYGATEELWFPEWDLKGTPWTNEAMYTKWSPSTYAAELGKYKTPTLLIHGELDFRVPLNQGLEFYTALQRQGVPSKILIFPDEGHWVLKPQNSELWHKTVLDWLTKWLK